MKVFRTKPGYFKAAILKNMNELDKQYKELLQNILGFFSVMECQCYPVNAKYYLGLDGVKIGINTRTRSPLELTASRKLETEQMHALTREIKERFSL